MGTGFEPQFCTTWHAGAVGGGALPQAFTWPADAGNAALIPALSASALTALGGPTLAADIAGAGGAPPVSLPSGTARPAGGNGQGPPARANGAPPQ